MEKLNGTWLVGVSTGPDSMALLDMAINSGTKVAVAFVNYHQRSQADEEEEYIKKYTSERNIACHILNDEFSYTGNFEASARKWRYDFFVKLVKENDYAGVLLGHHEDDVLETYFMQEEKKLTPSYYGIKDEIIYEGIRVKRPLIKYTKKELVDYCENNNIKYFIDETNNEDNYTRNRIRHDIVEKLSRNDRDLVLKEIEMKNAVVQERNCRIDAYLKDDEIDLDLYKKLDEVDRLLALRLLVKDIKSFSEAYLKEIDNIILNKNDFMIELDNKYLLVQDEGKCFVVEKKSGYSFKYNSLDELKDVCEASFKVIEGVMGVNAVTLKDEDFPITIRNYEEGDRIELRFGTKKVNRFFIDRKIPKYKRDTWPIVLNSENKVILVPGLGCDISHYSIKPSISVIQYYK